MFRKLKERFTMEPVLAVPDLDKKNKDGSGCIGLCNRRGTVYGVQRQKMETGDIPF